MYIYIAEGGKEGGRREGGRRREEGRKGGKKEGRREGGRRREKGRKGGKKEGRREGGRREGGREGEGEEEEEWLIGLSSHSLSPLRDESKLLPIGVPVLLSIPPDTHLAVCMHVHVNVHVCTACSNVHVHM